jgi:hypothetical protein
MNESGDQGVSHPILPQLGKEELQGVRGFLPGKWLGRIAALVSLLFPLTIAFLHTVGLLHGAQSLVPEVDWSRNHPWYSFGVLCGFSVLAIAIQIFVERHAIWVRRTLQALAVQPSVVPSGYFRTGPYFDNPEDRARFSRADRAHEKVLSWIESSTRVPLYLIGDSGSGKSSLLNAFVLPTLRERGWIVVSTRAHQDPEGSLRDALAQTLGPRRNRQVEGPGLRSLIEAVPRRANVRLLLVLDQFEEFLILEKAEKQQTFAALVNGLQSNPVKGLTLLLVLRSEYERILEDIGLPFAQYPVNLYPIGRFPFAAANNFLARSGLELQPAAIDHLLTSAAELDETPGLVRPITLNVIGYVLAAGKAVAPSMDAGQLIRQYIEQAVGKPAIRDFAPQILGQLLTEQGTKRPRSEEELEKCTHLRRGEVRAVLNALGADALARPLDPVRGVWELSHDFVARAIARYLGRPRNELLHRGVFYAAPTLVGAVLLVAAGIVAWSYLNPYQIRYSLEKLGLNVNATADGLSVQASAGLTNDNFRQAGPLLAKLPALQALNLSKTAIEDLDPLKRVSSLKHLDLTETKIESVEPLKALTKLQSLSLYNTKIFELEPLMRLTELQQLKLGFVKAKDFSPLTHLTALQSLDMSFVTIERLEPLSHSTALEELNLIGTTVENLEPLKDLTRLKTLTLTRTRVKNLEPLKRLAALEYLDLEGTQVEDLTPLAGLSALRTLNLSRTKVTNLEPLKGVTSLFSLDLSSTNVMALEPLKGLPKLWSLNLAGTRIESLEAIKTFPELSVLEVGPMVSEEERSHFDSFRRDNKLRPVTIH